MYDARTGSPIHRGWHRLLDGDRGWGSIDVHPDRYGMTRYRLVVFPPGISEPERRRVRLARGWPMWGALIWVACEVWFTEVTGPWTARRDQLGKLALALMDADERLERGQISAADHEMTWWQVYDEIESRPSA